MSKPEQAIASNESTHDTDLAPVMPDSWPTGALVSLFLNVLAGLVVAGFLFFATSASRVLIVTAILSLCVSAGSTVFLSIKNKNLVRQLQDVRNDLRSCELQYDQKTKHIGITEITDSMSSSRWIPDAVMDWAQQHVRFLGVFGNKWVKDVKRQDNYRAMLTRIQLNGGKVQVLLLDPNCEAARKLARYRNLDDDFYKDFKSIEFYKTLSTQYDCFEIRLYDDHFPFLRMVLADGLCSISRFKTHKSSEETVKAPQLVFAPEGPDDNWTLYQAFVLLYDYLWSKARDPFASPPAPVDQAGS